MRVLIHARHRPSHPYALPRRRPGQPGTLGAGGSESGHEDGATLWTNVIGIDSARVSSHHLFWGLEWGDMEQHYCNWRNEV